MSDKVVKIVSPVGELHYVNITGQGKENYNGDGYNYVATLHLKKDSAEAKGLMDKIENILGVIPEGKNLGSKGFSELMKDEKGLFKITENTTEREKNAKPSGIIAFAFSTMTSFGDGKPKVIKVYNSANPPSKINLGEQMIGNGSKGAVSAGLKRYVNGRKIGVSLFLNAIQLVEFIPYEADDGFEAQDEGYTGTGEESFDPNTATADVETSEEVTTSKPKL